MSVAPEPVQAWVRTLRVEAEDVLAFELRRCDGQAWPETPPGAHVDLQLPQLGERQYSVLPRESEHSLWIAVQREAGGRGGSRWLHEQLRPGQTVAVGGPRNHFALDDGDGPACLIAGGIGITPLLAMADALQRLGRDWRLYYGVRHAGRAGFADWLRRWPGRVQLHLDDQAGAPLDLPAIVAAATAHHAGTQFYACGPAPLLAAFDAATAHLPAGQRHVEHFAAPAPAAGRADGGFEVELARSGRCLVVPPGTSLLDTLLEHGIAVPHSCRNGVCGSCETRVLAGMPEHHDLVLSPDERASGQSLMVCCSRAASPRLVLDL
ncbi:MAG: oxidoreductase [Burkholderiaceae bacterium]|nr:oxidoreductase [Burkholderiaceae bacterium]